MRSLIIGGNRSGKSERGEQLIAAAANSAEVIYIAPGLGSAHDPEFAARIAAHQKRRPAHWRTVESRDIAAVLRAEPEAFVLVDDLAAWLTSTIDASLGWTGDRTVADPEITELLAAIADFRGTIVFVSVEVGLGVLPATETGRQFADILGRLNTQLAELCDHSEFVIAGRSIALSGPGKPSTETIKQRPAHSGAANPNRPAITPVRRDNESRQRRGSTGSQSAVASSAVVGAGAAAAMVGHATNHRQAAAEPAQVAAVTGTGEEQQSARSAGEINADLPGFAAVQYYETPALFPRVSPPDREAHTAAYDRQDQLTKPAGSLGRLEELSVWYASCRGEVPPPPLDDVRVVVFAGDHGIAAHGVSAYPQEVTVQMVGNILSGGAAVSVLARQHDASVVVADMSVGGDTPESARQWKVSYSTGAIDRENAMTHEETVAAIAVGRRIADEAVDSGADLLIAGDLGIGNTTPATVLTSLICGLEPVVAVGRGTGVDDNGWMRKTMAVRDAMFRAREFARRPVPLLETVGGPDLAAMAGFIAQAAVRKTPVLLDGLVVTAAALVADEMAPGARNWWQAGHRSVEPGHTEALKYLGLEPIIEAEMRLGEGSGAVASLPILRSAVAILREMATFADAGVATKSTDSEV